MAQHQLTASIEIPDHIDPEGVRIIILRLLDRIESLLASPDIYETSVLKMAGDSIAKLTEIAKGERQ